MTVVAEGAVTSTARPALRGLEVPEVRQLRYHVEDRPFLVLFETTRACDLACAHCRAEAQPACDPDELSTAEVTAVLDDLAAAGSPRPIVVLTGGDPFKRADLRQLIEHGAGLGLAMAVSPSGTPLATEANLAGVRAAGAGVVSFSLDGAGPASHDAFRGVPGSFALTVEACRAARRVGLRLQVNTTVTAATVEELPETVRLVRELDAGLWSVFFLVPTGRGRRLGALGPDEVEDVLHLLAEASATTTLKTTEAPQYRRVLHERAARGAGRRGRRARAPVPPPPRPSARGARLVAAGRAGPRPGRRERSRRVAPGPVGRWRRQRSGVRVPRGRGVPERVPAPGRR